jgi:predicted short-subunit dehydrogenase-like oxidoreductase (DUF2520 family)
MRTPLKIALVGNGNVGTYLWKAFANTDVHCGLFARKPEGNQHALESLYSKIALFDVVLLCVKDDAIASLSATLPAGNYLLAHCSGAANLNVLDAKHAQRGVFYPLMSLKAGHAVSPNQIPFCLEWEQEDSLDTLTELSNALGAAWFPVNSTQREQLHLAAVFAHNFSNHMFRIAQDLLDTHHLDFKILLPLLQQNLEMLHHKKAKDLQTGPAIRQDTGTINKHLHLLPNETLKVLYSTITNSIQHPDEH